MTDRAENVRNVIIAMFTQRGYSDIDSSEDNRILATKPDGNQICAFSSIIKKLNVGEIHNHIAILNDTKISHGLIVYEGNPTPAVNKAIAITPESKMNIELFHADDLQINITEHRLVPKHKRASKEEIKDLKEKKLDNNLPIIKSDDPASRFYNFSKGEIIQMTYKNGYVSYRVVR